MSILDRLKKFFAEARVEFRHVNWPTRNEAVKLTAIVIALSLLLAGFLGFFDLAFSYVLKNFIINK